MAVFVGVHKAAVPMLVDLLMHVFVGVAVRVVVLLAAAHRILQLVNHLYVRQNGRPPIPQRCLLRLPQQNLAHLRSFSQIGDTTSSFGAEVGWELMANSGPDNSGF